jgi:hypothetical protein
MVQAIYKIIYTYKGFKQHEGCIRWYYDGSKKQTKPEIMYNEIYNAGQFNILRNLSTITHIFKLFCPHIYKTFRMSWWGWENKHDNCLCTMPNKVNINIQYKNRLRIYNLHFFLFGDMLQAIYKIIYTHKGFILLKITSTQALADYL